MRWKTFPLKLNWHAQITPGIRHFSFERGDDESFTYEPGQFLNIHFEHDGQPIHRSYSVANSPPGNGAIEIAVSPVENGRATRLLYGLEPGDVIDASGPYGRFVLRDDPSCRYVLVGTSTGITPYRAMLPKIEGLLESGDHSFDMLLGVQNQRELLYVDEFRGIADRYPGFTFHGCLSREDPPAGIDDLHRGYVQNQFGRIGLSCERDIVYLCGNPDMIDASMEILKNAGFPTKQLRREKYLSAKS